MHQHARPRSGLSALAILATALTLAACGGSQAPKGSQERPYRIAVIPKGTTHEFWKSIHAGAIGREAAKGANVEIIWKGPLREDDREEQIKVVEDFMTQRDRRHRARAARRQGARAARRARPSARGIPVVIIDSALAVRPDRELRRDRQRRRAAGWRPSGSAQAARRQGQGPDAALPGGLGQHHRARARLPRRP